MDHVNSFLHIDALYGKIAGKYEVFAVVNHIGRTLDNGHYICHLRRNGKWWRASDHEVGEASAREISQDAYIVFCRACAEPKCSTAPEVAGSTGHASATANATESAGPVHSTAPNMAETTDHVCPTKEPTSAAHSALQLQDDVRLSITPTKEHHSTVASGVGLTDTLVQARECFLSGITVQLTRILRQ